MKIAIRDATRSDLRFMRRLGLDSVLHGVPYGRDVSNSAVRARMRETLANLEPDEDTAILIAYDQETEKPIGYIVLELRVPDTATGDAQSSIFDLAVHPRYWGTPAVRLLVHEAAKRTAAEGLSFMVGEVTAHNQRTYLQALRLGFELERLHIVMHCSDEGPQPMPGREESEKAYLQSRGNKSSPAEIPRNWEQLRESRRANSE